MIMFLIYYNALQNRAYSFNIYKYELVLMNANTQKRCIK